MELFFWPDRTCKQGERMCEHCGTKGEANFQGDKPTAPLQFLPIKGEEGFAWMCRRCKGLYAKAA